jgi:hypothetical protein
MPSVALATEDELTEAVGCRLLTETLGPLVPEFRLRQGGNGYLRTSIDKFSRFARTTPVVVITDLDRTVCAPQLLARWFGSRSKPEDLVLRVAVREVESWLIADHEGMSRLLGPRVRLPPDPDGIADPKRLLLTLAKRAAREVRADLVAQDGAAASQGLGYTARLAAFVEKDWSPERAAQKSSSLARARTAFAALAKRLASR